MKVSIDNDTHAKAAKLVLARLRTAQKQAKQRITMHSRLKDTDACAHSKVAKQYGAEANVLGWAASCIAKAIHEFEGSPNNLREIAK